MGRISPQDIRDQEFKQSPLGFNKDQVNDFLGEIADELETLIREANELHQENKEVRLALSTFKNVEDSLKETLVLAQKTAQETLQNAHSEADAILRKAKTEKEALLFAAQADLSQTQTEIQRLLARRNAILIKLKNSLQSNLDVLEEEFSEKDDETTFTTESQGGDERIVDFSKNDMVVDDLADDSEESEEPEINIQDARDFTPE